MKNENQFADISILPRTLGFATEAENEREKHELLVMSAGGRLFAIFAEEADHIIKASTEPTPLPRAPAPVLGIIGVRGRMRTVIAPAMLAAFENKQRVKQTESHAASLPRFIVALRGEEQLALAVEDAAHIITIYADEIKPIAHAEQLVRGVVQYNGELIVLVDPQQIFTAATARMERRRQRTKKS
jgi:chemotaxis signal transduction protein